ncbi:MAG: Histidine biosynthesis bifunctional protein HisB [Anaerolineae bacterium]|nr:Histidine biosynthesis bifunctional protein HisB [Anaerolineae bacterium]
MRAVFLDRDGVICTNRPDHVKTWPEFEFLPGAKESLVALARLDLPIVIVTNQAAVGRGLVSAQMVEEIHQKMVAQILAWGGRIDRVLCCPHRPEDECDCRKPKPGMLLQAAAELDIDLSQSYMVGDAATDVLAGQQAGCSAYLVLTGRGLQQLVPAFQSSVRPFTITKNLLTATQQIVNTELKLFDPVEMRQVPAKTNGKC